MLIRLSIKNIRKSIKDYAIYFFTLVLGVCIFYVFNAIEGQSSMLEVSRTKSDSIDQMVWAISSMSIVVSLILGFLIVYANRFLMKKRNREFGIEISCIPRNLIIVIFYYQISLKPLKTLSLSQVSFPLLFPLYYIVPPVFTNSDKGKYKGKKIL